MKQIVLPILLALVLTSCNGWVIQRGPFDPPTPFLPPTGTPFLVSATPDVRQASPTPPVATLTSPVFITATPTRTLISSPTPAPEETTPPAGPGIAVQVLGCNTSIDLTHGMGEVTNAFIVVQNSGGIGLTNMAVTLRALDEGREHPDKTVEVPSLPAGHQITLKLTVDSTYREETPIQVEVVADGGLFRRVGEASCRDLGLFAPDPADLGTPAPSNP